MLVSRGTDSPRFGSAVLTTVIWMLVTVRTGLNWSLIDDAFIRHPINRDYLPTEDSDVPWSYTGEAVGRIISFLGAL